MRKTIVLGVLLSVAVSGFCQNISPSYFKDVEKISNQYNTDMKKFLRGLDPKIERFQPAEQQKFCGILHTYANDYYHIVEKYRSELPLSYARTTKQDVINQVLASKEMQILSQYNIQCNLNN